MSKMNIKFPAEAFHKWIQKQGDETVSYCKKQMVATIYNIERRAKTIAPVNDGFLRGKIHSWIRADQLGGMVYTGVKYAPYQEFGTGTKVKVPPYVKTMFGVDSMEWKGRGIRKVNINAKPFLFNSAKIGYNEFIAKIKSMGFKEVQTFKTPKTNLNAGYGYR